VRRSRERANVSWTSKTCADFHSPGAQSLPRPCSLSSPFLPNCGNAKGLRSRGCPGRLLVGCCRGGAKLRQQCVWSSQAACHSGELFRKLNKMVMKDSQVTYLEPLGQSLADALAGKPGFAGAASGAEKAARRRDKWRPGLRGRDLSPARPLTPRGSVRCFGFRTWDGGFCSDKAGPNPGPGRCRRRAGSSAGSNGFLTQPRPGGADPAGPGGRGPG
jgi:hypothetical protein